MNRVHLAAEAVDVTVDDGQTQRQLRLDRLGGYIRGDESGAFVLCTVKP